MRSEPDEDSFSELFRLHLLRVTTYACYRVLPDDVQDVVAETFAVAWRRIDTAPPVAEALPWLLAIARRVAANQRRTRLRSTRLTDHLVRQRQPVVNDAFPSYAGEKVLIALSRLSPRDQEVLTLSAWSLLSPGEIAEVLGCSVNSASVRLHRAHRRLRDEYATTDQARHESSGATSDGISRCIPVTSSEV